MRSDCAFGDMKGVLDEWRRKGLVMMFLNYSGSDAVLQSDAHYNPEH